MASLTFRMSKDKKKNREANKYYDCHYYSTGRHAVAQLIEALRYKPESCGLDSQRDDLYFSLT